MTIQDKEIKVNQYYLVNGRAVRVIAASDSDVWYRVLDHRNIPMMVCDRSVFCSIAKEIKL